MATDSPQPPEGSTRFEPSGSDDEVPTINGNGDKLEPGKVLQGIVLNVKQADDDADNWWALLRLKDEERGRVDYFAKGPVKSAVVEGALTEGREVWIAKSTATETFETEDGETKEYHPTELSFLD